MNKKVLVSAAAVAAMSVAAIGATVSADEVKVGIVTDVGGVNDGSFNQSAWEGLQRAQEELGITASYLESATDADYIPNIETFVDEDYDMIICIGYQLADALRSEAEANPDVKFAIVDDATNADMENVTCLMFEQAQASYLAGYTAGLTTESNTIGFVLGMVTDTMNEFGYGYCAGALDANPDVTVLQANANSFADTAAGKTAANNMIADGADVIFHAAGGTGLGVIDACKEAGIWAIGVDSDQSSIAPATILTSAMKRVDNAVYEIAQATVEGTVEAGVKTFSLVDAGVDIAPTTDNLSEEVLATINEVKEKIIAGEIEVPKNKETFEAAHGEGIYQLAE
ncbi:MAG: BMP family ABC transporter substrate-binding protein [Eubacteriales bacterium]|nr:BMP family ABC transporter substrate-binding protein [Eubacteriales bacterium]